MSPRVLQETKTKPTLPASGGTADDNTAPRGFLALTRVQFSGSFVAQKKNSGDSEFKENEEIKTLQPKCCLARTASRSYFSTIFRRAVPDFGLATFSGV